MATCGERGGRRGNIGAGLKGANCGYKISYKDILYNMEHIASIYNNCKWKGKVKVTPSYPTLCSHIVHEILQARILEWVAFPFSRGSSQPRD